MYYKEGDYIIFKLINAYLYSLNIKPGIFYKIKKIESLYLFIENASNELVLIEEDDVRKYSIKLTDFL